MMIIFLLVLIFDYLKYVCLNQHRMLSDFNFLLFVNPLTVDFRAPIGFSHFRNVLHSVFFHSNQAVYCWSLWRFHYLNQNVLLKKISLVCFAVATNFSDCTAEAPGLVSPRDTKTKKMKNFNGIEHQHSQWKKHLPFNFFFSQAIFWFLFHYVVKTWFWIFIDSLLIKFVYTISEFGIIWKYWFYTFTKTLLLSHGKCIFVLNLTCIVSLQVPKVVLCSVWMWKGRSPPHSSVQLCGKSLCWCCRRLCTDWNCHCSSHSAVVSVSNVNISPTQTVCLSAPQWECCISNRDAAKCFKSEHMHR